MNRNARTSNVASPIGVQVIVYAHTKSHYETDQNKPLVILNKFHTDMNFTKEYSNTLLLQAFLDVKVKIKRVILKPIYIL